MAKSVFLSYRRDDSGGHTGRLYDRLVGRFGERRVFLDIDNIPPGVDFVDAIDSTLNECVVIVVVIGPRWLQVTATDGSRRIDDDADFHRLEIERAITRRRLILPVLVGGASMPRQAELPDSLRSLARRNAFEVTDKRFNYDAARLADSVEAMLSEEEQREAIERAKAHEAAREAELLLKREEEERLAKAATERIAREAQEGELQLKREQEERLAKAEAERMARETRQAELQLKREEEERRAKAEAERIAREAQEGELQLKREQEERLAKAEAERMARETRQAELQLKREEADRFAKAEVERKERGTHEAEPLTAEFVPVEAQQNLGNSKDAPEPAQQLPRPSRGSPHSGAQTVLSDLDLSKNRRTKWRGRLVVSVASVVGITLVVASAIATSSSDLWGNSAFALGDDFLEGLHGQPQNTAEAVNWYRKAAGKGNTRAQTKLGSMYELGQKGFEKNDTEARKWYSEAANWGYAPAQTALGSMYASGRGGPTDDTEAVKWYRSAAGQGYAPAQAFLGKAYDEGQGGLPNDKTEAAKWYNLAAAQGDQTAKDALAKGDSH